MAPGDANDLVTFGIQCRVRPAGYEVPHASWSSTNCPRNAVVKIDRARLRALTSAVAQT